MTVKTGLIPVVAVGLLTALAGIGFGAGPARAQDTCLDAPNGPAPPGNHWYFKTDRSTQRKCWYVRPQDQAAQPTSAQEVPQPIATEAMPASPAVNVTANQAAPRIPLPRARPALAAANDSAAPRQDGSQARSPSKTAATGWIDPAPPASAATYVWPDPPPSAADAAPASPGADSTSQVQPGSAETATQDTAAANTAAADTANPAPQQVTTGSTAALESAKPAPDAVPTAAAAHQGGAGAKPADQAAAGTGQSANTQSPGPIGWLLAGAIGLLIAGILLRYIVTRAFAPRRRIRIERREPVLVGSVATRPMPTLLTRSPSLVPRRSSNEQQVAEVEDALRKLGQQLRRRRLTPFKTIAPFFSGNSVGARVRP